MQFFHGTSISNVESIATTGLLPRRKLKSPGNWKTPGKVQSHGDFVYVAMYERGAAFHAMRTALANGEREGAILKLDIPTDNLYPDENACTKGYVKTMRDMRAGKSLMKKSKDLLDKSMKEWSICAHLGPIPKENINGFTRFNIDSTDGLWGGTFAGCKDRSEFDRRIDLLVYGQQWRLISPTNAEEEQEFIKQIRVEGNDMIFHNGRVISYDEHKIYVKA